MKQHALRSMHIIITVFVLSLPQMTYAQKVPTLPDSNFEVAYLAPDAPSFDLTIPQFRSQFNQANPTLPLHEYKVIASQDISAPYIRAASRINPYIYSSAILERGSEKIKSLQVSIVPESDTQNAAANQALIELYAIAFINQFAPNISPENTPELAAALKKFTDDTSPTHAVDARIGGLRYILVKSDNNVLTFAVEPIKLEVDAP